MASRGWRSRPTPALHPAGHLLGAGRRDRHHAGVPAHEARRTPARPEHRDRLGHRRRADLRRGDLARNASGCCASARWSGAPTTPTASTTASPPPTSRRRDSRADAISLVLAGGLVGGDPRPDQQPLHHRPARAEVHGRLPRPDLVCARHDGAAALHPHPDAERGGAGRFRAPAARDRRQPRFIVAVLSGAVSYGVMNFLMTSTPIAMQVCGHPYGDAAFVISSHVVAMFAPSFFTGRLIKRFGVLPVMLAGAVLNLRCDRHRARRARSDELLVGAGAAGCGLELPLHRRHHAPHRDLPARGARQGAGRQ